MRKCMLVVLSVCLTGCAGYAKFHYDEGGRLVQVDCNKSCKTTLNDGANTVSFDMQFKWPFEGGLVNLGLSRLHD